MVSYIVYRPESIVWVLAHTGFCADLWVSNGLYWKLFAPGYKVIAGDKRNPQS